VVIAVRERCAPGVLAVVALEGRLTRACLRVRVPLTVIRALRLRAVRSRPSFRADAATFHARSVLATSQAQRLVARRCARPTLLAQTLAISADRVFPARRCAHLGRTVRAAPSALTRTLARTAG